MKHTIICRHGSYEPGPDLNAEGQEQIVRLVGLMHRFIKPGDRIRLITSSAPRAEQSATIVSRQLGISGTQSFDELWVDNDHSMDLQRALVLVRMCEQDTDVLIAMTHYEYASELPKHIANELGNDEATALEPRTGQGSVIIHPHGRIIPLY